MDVLSNGPPTTADGPARRLFKPCAAGFAAPEPAAPRLRPTHAIQITFDAAAFGRNGVPTARDAANTVRAVLTEHGFIPGSDNLYRGDPVLVDAVQCVLAAQDLARRLPWLPRAVRQMRLLTLRIDETADLMPALRAAAPVAGA